jgi:putative ABC transport system permease protein
MEKIETASTIVAAIKIAVKNLTRQKKRTALLGSAIAFGFLVIVVLGSFTQGVLSNARDNLAGIFGGHVYVRGEELSSTGKRIARIGDQAALKEALATLDGEVVRAQIRSRARGDAIFGSVQESLTVEGVDWSAEANLWDDLGVVHGDRTSLSEKNAVILPASIATELGVQVGETILYRLSTVSGQANVGEFKLAAVYEEQESIGAQSAYTALPYLNSLLDLKEDEFQSVNLTLKRMEDMDAAAQRLSSELALEGAAVEPKETGLGAMSGFRAMLMGTGGSLAAGETAWKGTRFSITTLNEIMAPLLSLVQTLELVRIALFAILLLIIVVGLLNSFRMILIERTEEIGTMRALGMQRGGVRNIFLLEALFLALAGALAGLLVASLAMGILGSIHFGSGGAFAVFTHDGRFSFPFAPLDILSTLLFLAAGTLLSAWIPARSASRLKPVDALRASY